MIIPITFDHFEAGIDAQNGGTLAYFRTRRDDNLINWVRPQISDGADPLMSGCFPLVPFSNRIENGEFNYEKKHIELSINIPGEPYPIHGFSFQNPWEIKTQTSNELIIIQNINNPHWPWHYQTEQHFLLDADGLKIKISITNNGSENMPAGLGLHPYFLIEGGIKIKANVNSMFMNNDLSIPTEKTKNHPAITSLKSGNDLLHDLGTIYDDWDQSALLTWPDKQLKMTASKTLPYLIIFRPEGEDFFCVEPVSHCTNAVNMDKEKWGETGLINLPPKETLTGWLEMTPSKLR